jgi:hypothetical protein
MGAGSFRTAPLLLRNAMKYLVQFLRRGPGPEADPIQPDQILEELIQFVNDVDMVKAQAESLSACLSSGEKADGFRLLENDSREIYRWWRPA